MRKLNPSQYSRSTSKTLLARSMLLLSVFASPLALADSAQEGRSSKELGALHRDHGRSQNNGDMIRREEQLRREAYVRREQQARREAQHRRDEHARHRDHAQWRDHTHNGYRMRFHNGRWHHWHNGLFRLAAPPLGFWIPSLPIVHRTWTTSHAHYYLVDNTWFRASDQADGYIAVAAPLEASAPIVVAPAPLPPVAQLPTPLPPTRSFADSLFAYPRGTQTPARAATDKQECAQWSSSQVLNDPWAEPISDSQKTNYQRAFTACMEARNYVVR